MPRDSIILSFLLVLCEKICIWYNNSGYSHLFDRIVAFFSRAFSRSFVYRAFSNGEDREVSGVFVGIIEAIFGFFHRVFVRPVQFVANAGQKSACVCFVSFMAENWFRISVRIYGLFGLAFSLIKLMLDKLVSHRISTLTIALVMIALVACLFSQSLSGLYNGSFLRKMVGMPDVDGETEVSYDRKMAIGVATICGIVVGAMTILPHWYIIIAGVLGMIFLLLKPQWGAFLAIALFPFLPTMVVAGLVAVTIVCMFLRYLALDKKKIELDSFDLVMIGMCATFVYGVLFSHTPKSSLLVGMMYVLMAGSFFVFRRSFDREQNFYNLLDIMIVAASFVALYGLYQQFFGVADTTWQDTQMFEDIKTRVYSTFGNPNVLGEYLLITIPITLARFYYTKKNNNRFMLVVALAVQVGCMVYTFSRGCWIGLVLEIGLFLMLRGKKLLGIAVLAVLALPFVLPQSIVDRLLSIGNTGDSSTSYRVFIWEGTMRMLKDYGLSGVGLGTDAFNSVYPYYALSAVVAPHPHNLFLEILCESGILGLVMFFGCIICFFRSLGRCKKENHKLYSVAVALGSGMAGYLLQGMFDNVWYNYRIFFFFFVMMALSAVVRMLAIRRETTTAPASTVGKLEEK